ncbi:hypothetical protein TWF225_000983 [Orbilia oligospora]|uniref:Uncharacterized protein n=1 Tax=Orbilia oligospora TaxID=2813651 RepID=A0A7C8K3L8_ORBOL|nr:hypothetical protein TWF751_011887 [Orbilia oligospora]KAF3191763.1 hypothetical protein TWF225_000983 [Orbilia oligospora]KAF3250664.1 hypothetical protein TWF128_007510 [Orbilia oligospora]KAF3266836.1 hypothetical protein TWF217_000926 [Orbilia oligospora]KAF3273641.1 hypothetical protein TWF132_004824 [Orbilia oligospora]
MSQDVSSLLPVSTVTVHPTSTLPSLVTTSIGTATNTPASGGGGGTQNSPLLFFVALGFGVVFTNLWIIVGVKYCFRYNARNRARANGVDEVDLQALGARPHRRRREKKLMTVDEVNERFPVTKYKTWRANREVMGLSTAGGIAPTDGSAPVVATQTQTDLDPPASPLPKIPEPVADPTKPVTHERESQDQDRRIDQVETPAQPTAPTTIAVPTTTTATATTTGTTPTTATLTPNQRSSAEIQRVASNQHSDHEGEHDDDEPMPALPADMANSCGDTCAICIDNLEDSDDVRGLTCGHAFHTACIDPWLTARRACCPLCKADYYVPKPRTEAEIEAEEQARERRRQQAAELNRSPISAWWYRAEAYLMPSNPNNANRNGRQGRPEPQRTRRTSRHTRWNPFGRNTNPNSSTAGNTPAPNAGNIETQQASSNGPPAFLDRFSRRGRSNSGANPSAPEEPTPSTLEAGLANANASSTR